MNKNTLVELKEIGEVDIKELFKTLGRHKFFLFFMGLLFTLIFSVYAYYQPDVYHSDAMVEIGAVENQAAQQDDLLSMALRADKVNLDTEIGIMTSRHVALNTLKKVNLTHRYYAINGFSRPVELYDSVPFEVLMTKGENLLFTLFPIDSKKYRLEVEGEEDNGSTWSYNKLQQYNKKVIDSHFTFTLLSKDVRQLKSEKYRFMVLDKKKTINYLQGNLNIAQLTELSSLVKINYNDTVALRTKDITDALATSYIQYAIESKTAEASSILEFIDQQLAYIDNGLKDSEDKLEEYKASISTVNLTSKADGVVKKLSEYETELKKINIKKKMLNTIYKKVKAGTNLETLSVSGLHLDERLDTLISKLQDALLERRPLLQKYTKAHRKVLSLNRVINQLKKMIRINIETLKTSIDQRQMLLAENVKDQKDMLETLPESERRLGRLKRNFNVNEKVYSFLLERRASAVIAKAGTISANKILDVATLPENTISPKRKIIAFSGLLLGLLLGIIYILFREYLDTRVKDENDLRKITSLPLIGTIPSFVASEGKAKVLESPKSEASEAFRTLRTNLSFLSQVEGSLMITSTSTVSGEGKTTISINLGAVMALTGKKVVIVDLDMRKPQLHKRLQLSNSKGISSVLSKQETLLDVIQHVQHAEYAGIDIISSGPIPPNPSELIESDMMIEVIKELKETYDIVFFDTPPVGIVTDALIIMPMSDVSIYVVRAGYSEKDFLNNVERIVDEYDIKGLGIVLNDVAYQKIGYRYGKSYYEEE